LLFEIAQSAFDSLLGLGRDSGEPLLDHLPGLIHATHQILRSHGICCAPRSGGRLAIVIVIRHTLEALLKLAGLLGKILLLLSDFLPFFLSARSLGVLCQLLGLVADLRLLLLQALCLIVSLPELLLRIPAVLRILQQLLGPL